MYRNVILDSHLIIYRITDNRIEVLNIIHPASIVPFIAFKFGYSCEINDGFYGCGFYAAPSAGVKFMMGQKTALNFSLGYSAQKDEGINSGGFSIKMGVEF